MWARATKKANYCWRGVKHWPRVLAIVNAPHRQDAPVSSHRCRSDPKGHGGSGWTESCGFPAVFLRWERFSSQTNAALSSVISFFFFLLFPFQKRHRSDKRVNNRKVQVLNDRKYVEAVFRFCCWWKTQLCCILALFGSPCGNFLHLFSTLLGFFDTKKKKRCLNQIPGSNTT